MKINICIFLSQRKTHDINLAISLFPKCMQFPPLTGSGDISSSVIHRSVSLFCKQLCTALCDSCLFGMTKSRLTRLGTRHLSIIMWVQMHYNLTTFFVKNCQISQNLTQTKQVLKISRAIKIIKNPARFKLMTYIISVYNLDLL